VYIEGNERDKPREAESKVEKSKRNDKYRRIDKEFGSEQSRLARKFRIRLAN
jgi:hypothetical protein